MLYTIKLSFTIALLFFSMGIHVNAQESYSLKGIITDASTGKPLEGATVFIKGLDRGAAANAEGNYMIEQIPGGTYHILVRFVGYESLEFELDITSNVTKNILLKQDMYQLEDVLVQGRRDSLAESSLSRSVIEHAELERSRGQVLADVLKSVPGVTTLSTGPSISKPVIRGLHSQRLVLLNNGIQQEGQQWGGEHAPEIDPFMPDRIEVVRGAAGVEYGAGAIGGVIKVDNNSINKTSDLSGEAIINGYTNNVQGAGSVRLEGGLDRIKGLGWRVQGSFRRAGDSRTPKDVISNSGFQETDYSLQLNYEKGRAEHDLYFSHFGTELGIYSGAHIGNTSDLLRVIERGRPLVDHDFSFDIDAPKQKVKHNLFSYNLIYDFPEAGYLDVQYGYQQNDRQEFDAHGPAGGDPGDDPAFDLTLFTHSLNLKYRHNPTNGFYGTIGFSGMRQGNVRGSVGFLIPNFRSYSGGVYAIENWTNDTWTFEAGLRYDIHWRRVFMFEDDQVQERDFNYNNLTFVGGIIRKLGDRWSVSTNFGSAWRPPGVNEQFSDGVHHGTAQFEVGDPALDVERSYNIDVTVRNVSPKSYLQISGYNNFISDYIFLEPSAEPVLTIRGSFPRFEYRSTDARLRGIDGVFEYQLTNRMRLGTSFSLIRADNLDEDVPLIFIPSDRISFSAHFDVPNLGSLKNNFIELSSTLVAEQNRFPEGVDFTDPPRGYHLLNLQVGTRLGNQSDAPRLSLAVNNLLNETYREYLSRFRYFIDEPGRNLVLRLNIPFGQRN